MIELENVTLAIDEVTIVEDISFTVEPGELVGVIGPNGAGKSTLLRTIDGILEPRAGTIRVGGDRIESLTARELARRIAVLSQSTEIHFDFSVHDVVAMGRTPYVNRFGNGDARASQVVEDAMARTEVDHLAERPVTTVSGGERQRVLIARAIAQETPALLLDEPTASLDINHQIATFERVRDLADDDKAILAAIHDLDLAARYCDRLVLLAHGEQLACGRPESVLTNDLVGRAYGTRAGVRRDVLTGTISVTALPDRPNHPGIPVHVIGWDGAAGPVCRVLDGAGYRPSVGIVRENGPDHVVADALGIESVTRPPGAPMDDKTWRTHEQLMRDAALTVLAPVHVGPHTITLLSSALDAERLVLVDDPPFEERNHADERGRCVWNQLQNRHRTVSMSELLEAVAETIAGDHTPLELPNEREPVPSNREL